jgi:hypothetical protein
MSTSASGGSGHGVSVGSTSEFSLLFHVKAGHKEAVREALRMLQSSPGGAVALIGRWAALPWVVLVVAVIGTVRGR